MLGTGCFFSYYCLDYYIYFAPFSLTDNPNPPNVTISNCSAMPPLISTNISSTNNNIGNNDITISTNNFGTTSINTSNVQLSTNSDTNSYTNSSTSPNIESSQFLLNTRQMVTASRLDPELLLASCANNKEIDEVDLDRMYMEAIFEEVKCNMSR